jgi:HlyD family secretion protein
MITFHSSDARGASAPCAWVIRLSFAGALAASGCQPPEPSATAATTTKPSEPELPKVSVVHPVKQAIAQKTVQPGRIEPFLYAPLLPRATGYVQQVFVDIGDRVAGPKLDDKGNVIEPGQPLLVISAPEINEQLRQSEASLRQAEAAILVAQAAVQSAQALVEQSRADAEKTQADVKRWQSEYERVKSLADAKAVTAKLAEETEQQFRAAEASQSAAQAKVRSMSARASEAEVGVTKARADADAIRARQAVAEAAVRQAQAMVDYLTLRAPFDGIITERNIDPGRLVQPGANQEPLLTVIQAETVRLFIDVPEGDAVLVEPGRKAAIRVPSAQGHSFEGTVTRVSWSLQQGNRTLRTEFALPNPEGLLRPGMFAEVELTVASKDDALVVPKTAVTTVEGQPACMTVKDGIVHARPVRLGLRTMKDVEILSGLSESDAVISANASAFKPGQQVALNEPAKP